MRWLKHLTSAHDDPALSAILTEFGAEGYGFYWLILEHVAFGMEKDSDAIPSRTHSAVEWCLICNCSSTTKLRNLLSRMQSLSLIECDSSAIRKRFGNRSEAELKQIKIPKLLKYRDEYQKKSGQKTDILRARAPVQREIEIEIEIESESKEKRKTHAPTPPAAAQPIPETPEPCAPECLLTPEEFERAWARHRNYSRAHRETKSAVLRELVAMNGEFDPALFRDHHPAWCEYWERKGWNAFGSVTFLGWIKAGMPLPPPEAELIDYAAQREAAKRKRMWGEEDE